MVIKSKEKVFKIIDLMRSALHDMGVTQIEVARILIINVMRIYDFESGIVDGHLNKVKLAAIIKYLEQMNDKNTEID